MKILIVNSLYPPYIIGGAEVSSQKLAEELAKAGHSVSVLATGKENIDEEIGRVKVYRRHFSNIMSFWEFKHSTPIKRLIYKVADIYNPLNRKTIMEIIKKVAPDIIHTNTIYGISPVIWECAKSLKVPIVQTVRDYYLMCPKANLMKRDGEECNKPNMICNGFREFHRKMSNTVNAVTAPSKYTLTRFLDEGYFSDSIKKVIYNAVDYDLTRFRVLAQKHIESKRTPMHVIYVGSFIETKGIHVLLEAIKQCPEDIVFHFAGKGRLLPEIQKAAESNSNVILEGFLHEESLNKLMSEMDLLVCPSIWAEPFGRVIIDAYKSCVPVIGTRCGGIPELIQDKMTGLVIEPNSSIALANAISSMKASKLTENMVIAMENKLMEFSIENQRIQFENLYKKIIGVEGGGLIIVSLLLCLYQRHFALWKGVACYLMQRDRRETDEADICA